MSKPNPALKDFMSKLNHAVNDMKSQATQFFTKRSAAAAGGGGGGSSYRSGDPKPASGMFKWYPREFGVGLAESVAGHSAFVANTPQKFDSAYAKHFLLLECLTIVPVFCVSTVHYASSFCLYPSRAALLPGLHTELANRSKAISFWSEHVTKLSPQTAVLFRSSMLGMQMCTMPVWMFLAAASPSVLHCMLERSNEILVMKYGSLEQNSPVALSHIRDSAAQAAVFHKPHCLIKTDYAAALFLMLLMFFLCS